jgi:hypothetical protein
MSTGRIVWDWLFWSIVVLDGIGALTLIVASEGSQDAAGRGMQSGFGVIALSLIAALALLCWFVQTPFARVPVFIVLLAPALFIATRFGR